eukprot:363729-Chlamydomonas_euryale.AAC.8
MPWHIPGALVSRNAAPSKRSMQTPWHAKAALTVMRGAAEAAFKRRGVAEAAFKRRGVAEAAFKRRGAAEAAFKRRGAAEAAFKRRGVAEAAPVPCLADATRNLHHVSAAAPAPTSRTLWGYNRCVWHTTHTCHGGVLMCLAHNPYMPRRRVRKKLNGYEGCREGCQKHFGKHVAMVVGKDSADSAHQSLGRTSLARQLIPRNGLNPFQAATGLARLYAT